METPGTGIPAGLARRLSMAEQHEYLRRRLARRSVLAAGGGTLLAACTGGGDEPSPGPTTRSALTAPFGRRLALGADPTTQVTVSWQVPLAVRKPYVRIGRRPDDLGHRIAAEIRPLKTPALTDDLPAVEQHYVHAALDGLEPGTTYHYRIGHEGYGNGPAATLRTAPAKPARFTFTAFGDQGTGPAARALTKLVADRSPSFHLHAGDLCYADATGHGDDGDTYDARVWDRFLRQTDPAAAHVPWMVTTGNHDMEAWYSPNGYGGQTARWSLPDSGFDPREAPGAYAFRYGNTGFIALDANDVSYEIPANLGYTDGSQTRWLDRRLAEFRADAALDFTVVFFHHCAFSSSRHASDGGVRAAWVPLFDKHRVDLVINGHNHVYERTDAIRHGALARPLPLGGSLAPSRAGTVYVTAGGGGRELFDFPAPDSYERHEHHRDSVATFTWTRSKDKDRTRVDWSRVRYTGFSYLAVEAVPGAHPRLRAAAYAESGARIDHFELTKR